MNKGIGVVLIIIIALFIKAIHLEGMSRRQGVVMRIEKTPAGRFGRSYAELPIAKFEYHGKEYQSRADIGAKFYNNYQIGDTITVYFPNREPNLAEVYSFWSYWLSLPFIGVLILIIMGWLGIYTVLVMREDA